MTVTSKLRILGPTLARNVPQSCQNKNFIYYSDFYHMIFSVNTVFRGKNIK